MSSPILTRLYSPDDFGLLAVFAALLVIIGVVSSLRYQVAIPLTQTELEAADLSVLCLLIVTGMTAAVSLVVLFGRLQIANLLGVTELARYLWLLPLGVLGLGLFQVFNYWSLRFKRFPAIAGAKLKQSIVGAAIMLGGYSLGVGALLLGQIAVKSAGSLSLAVPAVRRPEFRGVTLSGIGKAARRYRRFPIFSTWSGFFNTAGNNLPPLLFASLFSPAAAGLYALAHQTLKLPMLFVGQAVGEVFLPNSVEARREGRLAPFVAKVHAKLAHIAMAPSLVLMIAGPDLFEVAFGESWRPAGVFARWMAPWLYAKFLASPLSTLFSILEKQDHGLFFQILMLVVRVGAILLGAFIGDIILTVILFSLGNAFCYLLLLVWEMKYSGNTLFSIIQTSFGAFLWGMMLVCPLMAGHVFNVGYVFWLVLLAITAILIMLRYYQLSKYAY